MTENRTGDRQIGAHHRRQQNVSSIRGRVSPIAHGKTSKRRSICPSEARSLMSNASRTLADARQARHSYVRMSEAGLIPAPNSPIGGTTRGC